jgi:hypothetical protein
VKSEYRNNQTIKSEQSKVLDEVEILLAKQKDRKERILYEYESVIKQACFILMKLGEKEE